MILASATGRLWVPAERWTDTTWATDALETRLRACSKSMTPTALVEDDDYVWAFEATGVDLDAMRDAIRDVAMIAGDLVSMRAEAICSDGRRVTMVPEADDVSVTFDGPTQTPADRIAKMADDSHDEATPKPATPDSLGDMFLSRIAPMVDPSDPRQIECLVRARTEVVATARHLVDDIRACAETAQ